MSWLGPPANAPLRRHAFATLTEDGWAALLADRPALAAEPWITTWAARGWPLVVRRASLGESGVPLGMALPPAAGKRRLAVQLEPGALKAVREAPAPSEAAHAAPLAWRPVLRELQLLGERCRARPLVFGSLAWQTLTEQPYLTDTSDLDALFLLASDTQVRALLDGLAALDAWAPMRIDGELIRADGAGVNWRELCADSPEVIVKTATGAVLTSAAGFLEAVS